MTDSQDPVKIAELQEKMEHGWRALNAALRQFDDSEMTAEDPQTGWSIKDHLAHLAAWEAGVVEVLRYGDRAAAMGLSENEWFELSMDQINDVIYERNKGRSLNEVRAHLDQAHTGMVSAVSDLSDEDLLRNYGSFQPQEYGSIVDQPIIGFIVGDSYDHFAEHLKYLEGRLTSGD